MVCPIWVRHRELINFKFSLKSFRTFEAIAAVTQAANAPFAIQPITVDYPRPGEILVDIKAVGICHSDLAIVSGAFGTIFPAVLGNEGVGIAEAVGKGVTKVAAGDDPQLNKRSTAEHRDRYADVSEVLLALLRRDDDVFELARVSGARRGLRRAGSRDDRPGRSRRCLFALNRLCGCKCDNEPRNRNQ